MKNKIFIFIILILLYCLSGCDDFFDNIQQDPVINRANPYIEKIELNNAELKDYAYEVINSSESNTKEGYINAIYRYIVENFQYIEDPSNEELIKTPFMTMVDGGGDCEDLTILLNSLLENIGITTFLVMNETHAYSLIYDVNTSLLWREIEKSFIDLSIEKWGDRIIKNYKATIILKENELWYYGGNGSYFNDYIEYMNISYDISSEKPVNLYLVPSNSDFENLSENKFFYQYEDYLEKNIFKTKNQLSYVDRYGGLILQNERRGDTKIDVNISIYLHPSFYEYYKNNTIKVYSIGGFNCTVLDCTAGEWGYPGYDAGIKGEKIAISSTSREYYYLNDD